MILTYIPYPSENRSFDYNLYDKIFGAIYDRMDGKNAFRGNDERASLRFVDSSSNYEMYSTRDR